MKFSMDRYYEGISSINTDDILTAVKTSMNYEADLYADGKLVTSWMGFTMEENAKRLRAYGITVYVHKDRYCFKYTDESKNIKSFYTDAFEYTWDGAKCVDIKIHDYRANKTDIEFTSLDEVIAFVKEKYMPIVALENIHVTQYGDDGCEFIKLVLWLPKIMSFASVQI
ncbi:hypothetical protein [Alicyclobacillus fodiniaquatilis]|uniref:Uncharacterized protein n=1 Tax=Alicyclobacillus fodiniaquatilis TaxID=1661150 RepID=A0ABW4JH15_9BACL